MQIAGYISVSVGLVLIFGGFIYAVYNMYKAATTQNMYKPVTRPEVSSFRQTAIRRKRPFRDALAKSIAAIIAIAFGGLLLFVGVILLLVHYLG